MPDDKKIMDKIILEVEKNGSDIWLSSDASKFLGKDKVQEVEVNKIKLYRLQNKGGLFFKAVKFMVD